MDSKKIENAFVEVIEALGNVQYKKELKDTPKRIADSYKEIFYGIGINPKEVLKRTFEANNDEQLIIEKNIDFYSMCEHHFLPFFGTICIAYIPSKKIFGFGDILKLIEILSRRPQLQERLTDEIAKYIYELLDCQGVYVVIEAKHLCMTMRGQKKENTKILTTSAKGIFETDINKKLEVLTLLK
ncbi:GTP cyclohydrolase I FolE [Fusobacterium nucleatum]|mgnify:FL=1|jgi:GTP cyclohydrolase I|uniref:GTP cyclohydrolase I FolE n=1 Tax=Fusobacterium TaxID=848 RepID=UPI0012380021|nr:GTP cyclohydrolase I FolE [Fusobacterium nucleatum]WDA45885.1 GTP cyclohydrolase I FolE [Fusobacterium nucleatum]